MKDILFEKRIDPEKRLKIMTVSHGTEDKKCVTKVRKRFLYSVSETDKIDPQVDAPEIYIRKTINTKEKTECFVFHVKGSFYVTHGRVMYTVLFHHKLNVEIIWKNKIFSPNKSEVLT